MAHIKSLVKECHLHAFTGSLISVARRDVTATAKAAPVTRMRPAARDVNSTLGVPTVTKLAVGIVLTPMTIPLPFAIGLENVSSDVRKPSEALSELSHVLKAVWTETVIDLPELV